MMSILGKEKTNSLISYLSTINDSLYFNAPIFFLNVTTLKWSLRLEFNQRLSLVLFLIIIYSTYYKDIHKIKFWSKIT